MTNETPFYKIWIDVSGPLPLVEVPAGHYGLGIFLRRNAEPIGYFRVKAVPGSIFTPRQLGEIVMERGARDILRAALRTPPAAFPAETPSITVAICTKDRAWSLEPCLRSLVPLQFPDQTGKPQFEILVVDNAPSDSSTRELVNSQPSANYVVEPMPGLDFARNLAVRQASGRYIAFLDDDVTVDAAWFSGLLRALSENPDAACITGPVMPMELQTRAQILFEERGGFGRGFGTVRYTQHTIGNLTHPCNAGMFGAGCNMVFQRDFLFRLGLFDESLDTGAPLPGGGDLDIFYRVLRADGALVYESSMAIYHRHRADYKGLRKQMWTWGLGYMAFTMKNYRCDPANRFKLRWAAIGSFLFFTKMLAACCMGRWKHEWTADLAAWELAGAIKGIAGEYDRSKKRTAAIRERYAC